MTVSIALALYNGERFITEQLESILRQTYEDLEVVVVDDASRDGGTRIAEDLSRKDPRVHLYRNEKNLGLVPNFLKAVSLCKGDYVCFSDQDDVWRADKVKSLLGVMAGNEKNELTYSDLELGEGDNRSFWEVSRTRPKRGFVWPEALLRNISPGCAMMFRRPVADLLAKVAKDERLAVPGRLDDVLFMHDHLAYVFAASLGRIDFTPQKLLTYRQHASNNIGANYTAEKGRRHMIDGFRAQIDFLKDYLPVNDRGLAALRAFTDSLEHPPFINSPGQWKYYRNLRRDTLQEKSLGWAEGVFPGAFQKLRGTLR